MVQAVGESLHELRGTAIGFRAHNAPTGLVKRDKLLSEAFSEGFSECAVQRRFESGECKLRMLKNSLQA